MNETQREAFVHRYGHVFEHSAWVARRAWALRPFANPAALHAAMMTVVAQAGPAMQNALIAAHPELGAQIALTPESEAEQAGAGLRHLTEAEFARFEALNAAYRAKFGLPFIICVRHYDKAGILAAFERRLENDAAAEHAAALHEVSEITWLRLAEMDIPLPVSPPLSLPA